jgi:hypothetical protein
MEVSHPRWKRPIIHRQKLIIPEWDPEDLNTSTLWMAVRIYGRGEDLDDPDMLHKGVWILPNAKKRIFTGDQAAFYLEAGPLSVDRSGNTRYRVEYSIGSRTAGFVRRISPFAVDDSGISSSYERRGRRSLEQEVVFLSPGRLHQGWYEIRVTVTDLNTQKKGSASEEFYVIKE